MKICNLKKTEVTLNNKTKLKAKRNNLKKGSVATSQAKYNITS